MILFNYIRVIVKQKFILQIQNQRQIKIQLLLFHHCRISSFSIMIWNTFTPIWLHTLTHMTRKTNKKQQKQNFVY